jgi:succinate dehydrogenase / fumarate reductase, flavoprotein subunit
MERYAPTAKDLASRDVVSRSMTVEIREGAASAPRTTTSCCTWSTSGADVLMGAAARHHRDGKDLRWRRRDEGADPGAADGALQHGRRSDQPPRRGAAPDRGDPDAIVPGADGGGRGGCASVHGANRLGTNSLLDIVVFGRAAALRCAEVIKPGSSHAADCRRTRPTLPSHGSTGCATPTDR